MKRIIVTDFATFLSLYEDGKDFYQLLVPDSELFEIIIHVEARNLLLRNEGEAIKSLIKLELLYVAADS